MPSLFVLPGKRLNRSTLGSCAIPGAGVITAQKGLVNASLFELYRPLRRQRSAERTETSSRVRRVLIPRQRFSSALLLRAWYPTKAAAPNARHLFQPLDVALFRGFKREMSRCHGAFFIARKSSQSQRKKRLRSQAQRIARRLLATRRCDQRIQRHVVCFQRRSLQC